jgi:hypothetical protein
MFTHKESEFPGVPEVCVCVGGGGGGGGGGGIQMTGAQQRI